MPVVADPSEDRCPGALRVHQAADGAVMRLRLPGGQIEARQLHVVAACAAAEGDGTIDLTARGNLQLRGMPDEASARRVADRLAEAGLLPSPAHERVRNIVASPLSGRDRAGAVDIRPLVRRLDAALRSAPDLAALSGRFLFALDDGRGDVAGLGADLCWRADSGALLLAGVDHGLRAGAGRATAGLIAAARAFLGVRGDRADLWRVRDLPGGHAALAEVLIGQEEFGVSVSASTASTVDIGDGGPPLGAYPQGFVVAAAPLGRLRAAQAELVADLAADDPIVVTPWRSLVLEPTDADAAVADLTHAGLLVDASSPWLGVSACVGKPGCASALADVRADATAAVSRALPTGNRRAEVPVHWVGCERSCGRPAGPAVLMTATGRGYRITGPGGEIADVRSSR
jgi:precorrin-3B synthase